MFSDPTAEAIYRGVLAEPADDTPRLALADWLEDHGSPDRAEYVRVAVELAKTPRFDQASDFIIPDEFNPAALIEAN